MVFINLSNSDNLYKGTYFSLLLMDIKIIGRRTKNKWKIMIEDEETILNPIKKKLINDKTITFAGYKKEHPLLNKIKLVIKGKDVKKSFKKALNDYKSDLEFLRKEF